MPIGHDCVSDAPHEHNDAHSQADTATEGACAVDMVLCNQDILDGVFGLLSLSDLSKVACVSRLWRNVANGDDFWRDVSFEGRWLTTKQAGSPRG